jgi:hypothetical protein
MGLFGRKPETADGPILPPPEKPAPKRHNHAEYKDGCCASCHYFSKYDDEGFRGHCWRFPPGGIPASLVGFCAEWIVFGKGRPTRDDLWEAHKARNQPNPGRSGPEVRE